jgi:MoaA/NifB/PqqE/SkfB family radical SAM enzyme
MIQKKYSFAQNQISSLQKAIHNFYILLGGALSKERALTGPKRVILGITDYCNYNCLMCREHSPLVPVKCQNGETDLSSKENTLDKLEKLGLDVYCRLIDDLRKVGTREINISGRGEPFVHEDILQMIEYAQTNGFNISITTNGSLLNKEKAKFLVDIGVYAIYFSINAGSSETYMKITGRRRSGLFVKVKDNVKTLALLQKEKRRNYPRLMLSFVISSQNYFEIKSMIRFAIESGVNRINFVPVSSYFDSYSFLDLSPEDKKLLQKDIYQAKLLANQHGLMHNINELIQWVNMKKSGSINEVYLKMSCYVGWFLSLVLANGDVIPCCHCKKTMGNIHERSFREIWNSPAYRKFRKESKNFAVRSKSLSNCQCSKCNFVPTNLIFHKILHPLRPLPMGDEELMGRLKDKAGTF